MLDVADLDGPYLKAVVDNGDGTYTVTVQGADNAEATVTISELGGLDEAAVDVRVNVVAADACVDLDYAGSTLTCTQLDGGTDSVTIATTGTTDGVASAVDLTVSSGTLSIQIDRTEGGSIASSVALPSGGGTSDGVIEDVDLTFVANVLGIEIDRTLGVDLASSVPLPIPNVVANPMTSPLNVLQELTIGTMDYVVGNVPTAVDLTVASGVLSIEVDRVFGGNLVSSVTLPSGGGGTTVVPNPGGSPSATLSTVTIDATDYTVGAGGGGLDEAAVDVRVNVVAADACVDLDYAGSTLTCTQLDGSTDQVTITTTGTTDGVVSGGSVSGTTLTLTRTEGGDVTISGLPSNTGPQGPAGVAGMDGAIGPANGPAADQQGPAGSDSRRHADGVVTGVTADTEAHTITLMRSESLDDLTADLPFEVVVPDGTTGVLRTATVTDFDDRRIAVDHQNIRVVTRVGGPTSGTATYVTYSRSNFLGTFSVAAAAPNPSEDDVVYTTTDGLWCQYRSGRWQCGHGTPSQWRGAFHTQAEATQHVIGIGDVLFWNGVSNPQQVSTFTPGVYDYEWQPEQERQILLDRPQLPRPASADADLGMVPKVVAGGAYELAPDAGGTVVVANPGTGSILLSNITIGAEDYALPFQVTANPPGIHGALTGLNISGSEYSVPEEVLFIPPDDVVLTQPPNTYRFDNTLAPQPGHIYFFSPKATNTGPVHILINGVSYGFLKAGETGGEEAFEGGELQLDIPLLAAYDGSGFAWIGATLGSAAIKDVGTEFAELAALGPHGRFSAALLGENPVVGYALKFTADGTSWEPDETGETQAESDARYILKSGDTMEGNFIVEHVTETAILARVPDANQTAFQGQRQGETFSFFSLDGEACGSNEAPGMEFGIGGTASRDVYLCRGGADLLRTPDDFEARSLDVTAAGLAETKANLDIPVDAYGVPTDVAGFDGPLSASETNVQRALDVLDNAVDDNSRRVVLSEAFLEYQINEGADQYYSGPAEFNWNGNLYLATADIGIHRFRVRAHPTQTEHGDRDYYGGAWRVTRTDLTTYPAVFGTYSRGRIRIGNSGAFSSGVVTVDLDTDALLETQFDSAFRVQAGEYFVLAVHVFPFSTDTLHSHPGIVETSHAGDTGYPHETIEFIARAREGMPFPDQSINSYLGPPLLNDPVIPAFMEFDYGVLDAGISTIRSEGVQIYHGLTHLNFSGPGVSATHDSANDWANIAIPGVPGFDLSNLPVIPDTELHQDDLILVRDTSETENRRLAVSRLMADLPLNALVSTTTIDASADRLLVHSAADGRNNTVSLQSLASRMADGTTIFALNGTLSAPGTGGGGTADGVLDGAMMAFSGRTLQLTLERSIGNDIFTSIPIPADEYVDTLGVTVTGTNLNVTLGRAEGADLVATAVLPAGGSGSTVVANPAGTDGDDLTRIDIDGVNYNVAGGSPLAVSTEDIANVSFTEAVTATIDFTATNSAVDSGIAVPTNTKTILANYGAATDGATAAIDLPWFVLPIEEWDRLVGVDAGDGPTHASVRMTRTWRDADVTTTGGTMARQVWLGKGNNGNIFVWTDNTSWDIYPFRVRFEIHAPLTVVTGVTGGGGGGGTADGVVETAAMAVTGQELSLTLDRSIGADVTASVTLPAASADGVLSGAMMEFQGRSLQLTLERSIGNDIFTAIPLLADEFVDTLGATVTGTNLLITLGRAEGADLTATAVLPAGGGGTALNIAALDELTSTTIAPTDLLVAADVSDSDTNKRITLGSVVAHVADQDTILSTDSQIRADVVDTLAATVADDVLTVRLGRTESADLVDTATLPGPYDGAIGTQSLNPDDMVLLFDPGLDRIEQISGTNLSAALRLERGAFSNTRNYDQGDVVETGVGDDVIFWIASVDISQGGGAPTYASSGLWWKVAGHGFWREELDMGLTYSFHDGDSYHIGDEVFIVTSDVTGITGEALRMGDHILEISNFPISDEGVQVSDNTESLNFTGDAITCTGDRDVICDVTGGSPLAVSTEDIANVSFTEAVTATIDFTATNSAVDSGIAVPTNTKTILANYGAATDGATAAIDLPWFVLPIEEWDRLVGVDAGDGPTHASVRMTRTWRDADVTTTGGTMARQVWLGKGNNGNIFVWTDNTSWDIYPFRVRFEIHAPLTVVTGVTGEGGGGGTTVVANPGGSPASALSTVTIGLTDYTVGSGGGGSTVVANPGTSPTIGINEITIDGTDYGTAVRVEEQNNNRGNFIQVFDFLGVDFDVSNTVNPLRGEVNISIAAALTRDNEIADAFDGVTVSGRDFTFDQIGGGTATATVPLVDIDDYPTRVATLTVQDSFLVADFDNGNAVRHTTGFDLREFVQGETTGDGVADSLSLSGGTLTLGLTEGDDLTVANVPFTSVSNEAGTLEDNDRWLILHTSPLAVRYRTTTQMRADFGGTTVTANPDEDYTAYLDDVTIGTTGYEIRGDPIGGRNEIPVGNILSPGNRLLITSDAIDQEPQFMDMGTFREEVITHQGAWVAARSYNLGAVVYTPDNENLNYWIAADNIPSGTAQPTHGEPGDWYHLGHRATYFGNLGDDDATLDFYEGTMFLWQGDLYIVTDESLDTQLSTMVAGNNVVEVTNPFRHVVQLAQEAADDDEILIHDVSENTVIKREYSAFKADIATDDSEIDGRVATWARANSPSGSAPLTRGGTGATSASGARTNLGLGTAATVDTGTGSGDVPILNSSGDVATSVIPSSVTFDTELPSAIDLSQSSGTLSVSVTLPGRTDLSDTLALPFRTDSDIDGRVATWARANSPSGSAPLTRGGTGATSASGARTNLGLGTAATVDTGTGSGEIPILNSSGDVATSVIPSSVTFDTELPSAIDLSQSSGTLSVSVTLPGRTDLSDTLALPFRTDSDIDGRVATWARANSPSGSAPLTRGGTGATSASGARTSLGLGDVATLSFDDVHDMIVEMLEEMAVWPNFRVGSWALNSLNGDPTGITYTGSEVLVVDQSDRRGVPLQHHRRLPGLVGFEQSERQPHGDHIHGQ